MKNNILIAILIIVILILGYVSFSYFSSKPDSLVERVDYEGAKDQEVQELLRTLVIMQSLNIDVAFFESPIYKSLIDFSPNIQIPEIVGRGNPFAPMAE